MKTLKRIFSFAIGISILISCKEKSNDPFGEPLSSDLVKNGVTANTDHQQKDGPQIEFEKDNYSFGTINEGESVKFSFKFKNNGNEDLIIGEAKGSCGCTVPKYPTHPIEPGDEGVIDVEFNSAGKTGHQRKTISVITNATPSTRIIAIEGDVTPVAN
jgi:hypothetical protein